MKIFLVAVKSFANSLFETILEIMAISKALLNPGLPNGRRGGKDFQKKITAWECHDRMLMSAWDAVSMIMGCCQHATSSGQIWQLGAHKSPREGIKGLLYLSIG